MLTGPQLGAAIEAARKLKGVTKKELAQAFDIAPPSIQDWVKRGTIDKAKLEQLWAYFSDVVGPSHWGLKSWTDSQTANEGARPRGAVAQLLSYPPTQHSPLIDWKEIMQTDLPARFRVAMPDDSMAPRLRAGQVVELDRTEAPRPGDGVLVRDAGGALYLRAYRAGRQGQWQAYPVNEAYQPLESDRDSLTVVAVLVAVQGRWS